MMRRRARDGRMNTSMMRFVRRSGSFGLEVPGMLIHRQLSRSLAENAVALRLQAGSQEAGFLTPLCPINTFPTLLVIRYS